MLRFYTASMAGPYHKKNDIPCQDSFFVTTKNGAVFAAVCDGLGSMTKSDIGSKIVSETIVEYCAKHYTSSLEFTEIKKVMNNAFVYAYKAVLEEAEESKEISDEYDTTACMAIFDDGHIYFGQAGDSGIVALMNDGHYVQVTEQQRDEEGRVYPLCSGPEEWVFGEIDNVSSIMLMTDGIWEQIFPKLLNDNDNKINIAIAKMFMDRRENTDKEIETLQEEAFKYLENYPEQYLDDDKTVVVIYDIDKPAKKLEDEYYLVPDWENLYKKRLNKNNTLSEEPVEESCDDSEDSLASEENTTPAENISENIDCYVTDNKNSTNDSAVKSSDKEEQRPNTQKPAQPIGKSSIKITRAAVSGFKRIINIITDIPAPVMFVILLCFSMFAFLMSGLIKDHAPISYLSIFLLCLLTNATILLPASSLLVVLEFSLILNPIAVAICGALGASFGEMVGFLAGAKGRSIISSKLIKTLENKFPKHPYILIFLFSVLPLPFFDVVGVLSGAAKINTVKFLLLCLSGKLIKMLTIVCLGQTVKQFLV